MEACTGDDDVGVGIEVDFLDVAAEESSCDRLAFLLGRGDPSDEGRVLEVMLAWLLWLFVDERLTGTCIPRDGRDNDLRRVL